MKFCCAYFVLFLFIFAQPDRYFCLPQLNIVYLYSVVKTFPIRYLPDLCLFYLKILRLFILCWFTFCSGASNSSWLYSKIELPAFLYAKINIFCRKEEKCRALEELEELFIRWNDSLDKYTFVLCHFFMGSKHFLLQYLFSVSSLVFSFTFKACLSFSYFSTSPFLLFFVPSFWFAVWCRKRLTHRQKPPAENSSNWNSSHRYEEQKENEKKIFF